MMYFSNNEIKCPCCGINNIHDRFLNKLNRARKFANIPFNPSSMCRCEKHNKKVGGSETSSHISTIKKHCKAIDIKVNNSTDRFTIIYALLFAGFTRIGIGKDFIHADDDEDKPAKVAWLY